jgi:hypothetical protein
VEVAEAEAEAAVAGAEVRLAARVAAVPGVQAAARVLKEVRARPIPGARVLQAPAQILGVEIRTPTLAQMSTILKNETKSFSAFTLVRWRHRMTRAECCVRPFVPKSQI